MNQKWFYDSQTLEIKCVGKQGCRLVADAVGELKNGAQIKAYNSHGKLNQ